MSGPETVPLYLVVSTIHHTDRIGRPAHVRARQVDSDMFVWHCRCHHSDLLTIAAFYGSASPPVIVESVALAIMVSNDISFPRAAATRP